MYSVLVVMRVYNEDLCAGLVTFTAAYIGLPSCYEMLTVVSRNNVCHEISDICCVLNIHYIIVCGNAIRPRLSYL